MLVRLITLTGLPAVDSGQRVEIGVKGCQSHTGSLGVRRGERIDETKARPIRPEIKGAQD